MATEVLFVEDEQNGLEELKREEKQHSFTPCNGILGLDELLNLKLWTASLGELVGTAVLVFALDAIVISSYQTKTAAPTLTMSCIIALTLSILLLATVPVSGGHLNPTITFSAALMGLISISRATVYVSAQCVGAIIGALAIKSVVSGPIQDTFSLGGCTITIITPGPHGPIKMGLGMARALWLEIICTFVLLFTSLWLAFDSRQAKELGRVVVFLIVGIVVGLLVFISTTITAAEGYAGAGMNPARCLGPAVVRGGHLWNGHWIFWAGPAIACLAFHVYVKLIPRQHFCYRESIEAA